MSGDPLDLTVAQLASLTRSGQLSAVEIVDASLRRIEERDGAVRAFVVVLADEALRDAARLDALPPEARGALHGVPVGIKDIFDVAGVPTRRGAESFARAPAASADATTVARLRAAGAVVVGKTHTHELACGVYTPQTRNPWDPGRSAGGSSGGSGAAVAAGMVAAATGSDTGGSVRIPAALCGTVGLKPTYGRISRHGAATLSWSLDHVGVLARTVADAWDVASVLVGPDAGDPATWGQPVLARDPAPASLPLRLGIPRQVLTTGLTAAGSAAWTAALDLVAGTGVQLVELDVPELDDALPAEYTILQAEAATYYAALLADRPEAIGDGVRAVLERGMTIAATDYLRAQRVRGRLQSGFRRELARTGARAVLAPTVPCTAQRHDQLFTTEAGTEGIPAAFVRTTAPFNLTGMPSISIPSGLAPDGLPFGVQLAGPPHGEAELIATAQLLEHRFGHVRPPLPPAAVPASP